MLSIQFANSFLCKYLSRYSIMNIWILRNNEHTYLILHFWDHITCNIIYLSMASIRGVECWQYTNQTSMPFLEYMCTPFIILKMSWQRRGLSQGQLYYLPRICMILWPTSYILNPTSSIICNLFRCGIKTCINSITLPIAIISSVVGSQN